MAAFGLAANALLPQLSINSWAVLHSILAVLLVLFGRYSVFESAMKLMILLMFITVMTALANLDLSAINIQQTVSISTDIQRHGKMRSLSLAVLAAALPCCVIATGCAKRIGTPARHCRWRA
ncbi:hypothetical protein [Zhongshania borealis]|uniref:Uncharacterized protein n=1 Tax=Zhongshania borealis TaxID=889488 RepID=A0ABP7X123_9GAMM